jgi:hypothetical protein
MLLPLRSVVFKVWNSNGVVGTDDFLGAAEVPAAAAKTEIATSSVFPLRPARGNGAEEDDVVAAAFRRREKRLGTIAFTIRRAGTSAAPLPEPSDAQIAPAPLTPPPPPRRFQVAVFRCTGLRTRESVFLRGDSDPFVIVTRSGRALKLAATTVVDDDLNPEFDDGSDARAGDGARLMLHATDRDESTSIAARLRDLRFTVWDYNPIVAHERMGTAALCTDGDVALLTTGGDSGAWGHGVSIPLRPRAKEADPVLRAAWNGAGDTDDARAAAAPLGTVTVCGRWLD